MNKNILGSKAIDDIEDGSKVSDLELMLQIEKLSGNAETREFIKSNYQDLNTEHIARLNEMKTSVVVSVRVKAGDYLKSVIHDVSVSKVVNDYIKAL